MANRSNTQYSTLDTRRYLQDEDYKLILDFSFSQYNGKGYQQYGYFGQKQLTRVWGNVVKQDEIVVKASALGVGAGKPMRSTSGYDRYAGSIPKIGHGVKIGEDDLLHLQEVAAASQNRDSAMYQLMLDATIKQSNQLIIGMQNKLTSWVYEALSTGYIHNADIDGLQFDIDMNVPNANKFKTEAGKDWFNNSDLTTPNSASDPVGDMLVVQNYAGGAKIPVTHWEMTKKLWGKFINHPSVQTKCRNSINSVVNKELALTESQVVTQLHDLGILPIKIVDEKSYVEIDGIPQVDTDSFDPTSLVLAADPSRLFEYKNACSVLEEATRFGANKEGIYSFVGENGSIAVMNKWYEEEVTNKATAEQWVVPVPTNPKHICILNIFNSHVWA